MSFRNFEHLLDFLAVNKTAYCVHYWRQNGVELIDGVEIYTETQNFVVYDRENEPKNKYFSEGFAVRSLHDTNLKSEILSCMKG